MIILPDENGHLAPPMSWCQGCDRTVLEMLMDWTIDGWWLCEDCRSPKEALCCHGKAFKNFCGQCREYEKRTGQRKVAVPGSVFQVPGHPAHYTFDNDTEASFA